MGNMDNMPIVAQFINELNYRFAGTKVGHVRGYHDQWFLGGYYTRNGFVTCHFCQGRNVGRITAQGGFSVSFTVDDCNTLDDMFERFYALDNKYPDRRCGIDA